MLRTEQKRVCKSALFPAVIARHVSLTAQYCPRLVMLWANGSGAERLRNAFFRVNLIRFEISVDFDPKSAAAARCLLLLLKRLELIDLATPCSVSTQRDWLTASRLFFVERPAAGDCVRA